jgi:carbamate kinase
MRILAALGGKAPLSGGEPMTADAQRAYVRITAEARAEIHTGNELVITHRQGASSGPSGAAECRL